MSPCPECDLWLASLIVDFAIGFLKAVGLLIAIAVIVIPLAALTDRWARKK